MISAEHELPTLEECELEAESISWPTPTERAEVQAAEDEAELIQAEPPVPGAKLLELNVWLHPNGWVSVEGMDDGEEHLYSSEWQLAAKLMEMTGKKPKGTLKPWSHTQTFEDWVARGGVVTKVETPREAHAKPAAKPKVTLTLEDLGL